MNNKKRVGGKMKSNSNQIIKNLCTASDKEFDVAISKASGIQLMVSIIYSKESGDNKRADYLLKELEDREQKQYEAFRKMLEKDESCK